jgi:hypothetical protein
MNHPRPLPEASRLPTLTEVVLEGLPVAADPVPPAPPLDEAAVVDAVMAGCSRAST